ncbi:MAG: hypothetical protein ABI772_07075 [Bacteroidota bacterium]
MQGFKVWETHEVKDWQDSIQLTRQNYPEREGDKRGKELLFRE